MHQRIEPYRENGHIVDNFTLAVGDNYIAWQYKIYQGFAFQRLQYRKSLRHPVLSFTEALNRAPYTKDTQ